MSKRRYRIPVYVSGGHYVVRWVPQNTISQRLEDGEIFFHRATNQYRLTPLREKPEKPCIWSPTSLTVHDSYNLAGLNGAKAQKAAEYKLTIWKQVKDDKAICV